MEKERLEFIIKGRKEMLKLSVEAAKMNVARGLWDEKFRSKFGRRIAILEAKLKSGEYKKADRIEQLLPAWNE